MVCVEYGARQGSLGWSIWITWKAGKSRCLRPTPNLWHLNLWVWTQVKWLNPQGIQMSSGDSKVFKGSLTWLLLRFHESHRLSCDRGRGGLNSSPPSSTLSISAQSTDHFPRITKLLLGFPALSAFLLGHCSCGRSLLIHTPSPPLSLTLQHPLLLADSLWLRNNAGSAIRAGWGWMKSLLHWE